MMTFRLFHGQIMTLIGTTCSLFRITTCGARGKVKVDVTSEISRDVTQKCIA